MCRSVGKFEAGRTGQDAACSAPLIYFVFAAGGCCFYFFLFGTRFSMVLKVGWVSVTSVAETESGV